MVVSLWAEANIEQGGRKVKKSVGRWKRPGHVSAPGSLRRPILTDRPRLGPDQPIVGQHRVRECMSPMPPLQAVNGKLIPYRPGTV